MTKSLHVDTNSNEFYRRFPDCKFNNSQGPEGPAQVIGLFGASWETRCVEWAPVLIDWSITGEYESSVYILLKNAANEFAEVHGSTSSMWAFEGCWTPEPVSKAEIRAALDHGWLRDDPDNPLARVRKHVAEAIGVDLEPKKLSAKEQWEASRAQKSATANAPRKAKKSTP